VVPTILEACGIQAPDSVDGIKQKPIEGVSFAYTFDKSNANASSRHKTQYFEMMGDHALYHDGWIASTKVVRPPWITSGPVNQDPVNNVTWELYDLSKDWTQTNDLAKNNPAKLKELQDLFWKEADKYQVLPLDNSFVSRAITPRPSITAGRNVFTWTRPMTGRLTTWIAGMSRMFWKCAMLGLGSVSDDFASTMKKGRPSLVTRKSTSRFSLVLR